MNVLKTPGCVFVFLAGLLALAPPAAAQPKPLVVLA